VIGLNLSKHRFEFFSDGVMAIIITIMVLEIPLPMNFNYSGLISFLYSIFIFIVSFFIVGSFWNKHHWLIDKVDKITNKIVWRNMIFLLSLALLPLFTRWVLENPTELIPVIFYDILFIIVNLSYFIIAKEVYTEKHFTEKRIKRKNNRQISHMLIMGILLAAFLILASFYPEITIILFMGFPIITSLLNIFLDEVK
jgi:TMEM175 potassium channel family protein